MSKATLIEVQQSSGRAVRVYALSAPKAFPRFGNACLEGHGLGGTGSTR